MTIATPIASDADIAVLRRIEDRVLWLAMAMVHHANAVRPNPSGIKVGGHQGSSASLVSAMTALWFHHLTAPDRVSVKPHASPVLHAINHLLGRLDATALTTLREFGGLQSYPSRTKDPGPVDFSTGSVGIGASATLWAALAHRYVAGHFDAPLGGRQIALLGDAELDEGAIWEALVDPMVARLGEVMWIVDLNRQSLDRVVPDIAAGRLRDMFTAAGWHCITAKYGGILRGLFARPGGEQLRRRIDTMANEEYQSLLRAEPRRLRESLPGAGEDAAAIGRLIATLDDAALIGAIRDLGGHDLSTLLGAYAEADRIRDRPVVIFAYTIKGWRLPTEGHPANHSALLNAGQMRTLAELLGADPDDPWASLDPGSAESRLCAEVAGRLMRPPPIRVAPPAVPAALGPLHRGRLSTQQALGRFLGQLDRSAPEVAARVVTVSPDVATSTNLGGWINAGGVWAVGERVDWFAGDSQTLVRWREDDHGRHIELGIAETNLVGLLGELGLTWDRSGQPLIPIGTLYDPFVGRALEPWSFGIYAGGQSILIGTPSGITLAPEGGAHQSVVTPAIGIAQPGCTAWEPAFAQDLEWTLLAAMARIGRPGGDSAYFRLSTRPIDQSLARMPADAAGREARRADCLRGGYRLADPRAGGREPEVTLVAMGAVLPEVLAAGDVLERAGVAVEVICVVSADLTFRALLARRGLIADGDELEDLFPPSATAPIVSALDGHPSALAFLAGLRRAPIACHGVVGFGQSGDLVALYRAHDLDAEAIVGSALDLMS